LEYWPFAGANFHDFQWVDFFRVLDSIAVAHLSLYSHSRNAGLRSGNYSLTFFQIWDQVFGGTDKRYREWTKRRAEGESGDDVKEDERMVEEKKE
jgi:sterol desaturase/sphingolipid hydroxylase (fatty acid hydroxylase superfamily)